MGGEGQCCTQLLHACLAQLKIFPLVLLPLLMDSQSLMLLGQDLHDFALCDSEVSKTINIFNGMLSKSKCHLASMVLQKFFVFYGCYLYVSLYVDYISRIQNEHLS